MVFEITDGFLENRGVFKITGRFFALYFPIEVGCCRKAAKILRLILCAPLKVLRLRMTEYGVT